MSNRRRTGLLGVFAAGIEGLRSRKPDPAQVWAPTPEPTLGDPPSEAPADPPTRRQSNRRRAGTLLVAAAWVLPAAAALGAFSTPFLGVRAYDYMMSTGHFLVREVLVEGEGHLSAEDVRALAGIDGGTHVLATDLEGLARRLEEHPWIAQAAAARELPDRLRIRIDEHVPTALVPRGELWLANGSGELFARAGPELEADLPIITGVPLEAWDDPAQAAMARADVRAALNLARLFEAMGMDGRWPIAEVRVDPARRLSLVLSGSGTEAVLGHGPYRQKLYRLEWVLEKLHHEGQQAEYVLLDGPGGGVVREDSGRVVVRADLAPTTEELAERAVDRRERAEAARASAEGAGAIEELVVQDEAGPKPVSGGLSPAIGPVELEDQGQRSGATSGAAQGE